VHFKDSSTENCRNLVRGITYRRPLLFAIIVIIALSLAQTPDIASADWRNIDIGNKLSSSGGIKNKNTNPHFTGKYCDECHTRTPVKDQGKHLRYEGDFNKLCSCHDYKAGLYTHPTGIKPSEEKKARIPTDFSMENGILICSTCHDIYLQCQLPQLKSLNKKFLRGGPYIQRTDICFKCHDKNKYKKLDPHTQLNANGEIIEEVCLYCHLEKPDENKATYETIKLVGDIKMVCLRCHSTVQMHPSGRDHLKKPGEEMLDKMRTTEIIYTTIFPLDKEKRITCITCHNPHERGVIPKEYESAKGAGEKYKQRLARIMCSACHDEYGTDITITKNKGGQP
jgi:hypothetical protein